MFQPFEKFNTKFLEGLIKLKKTLLVTQTYGRAFDHFESDLKTNILVTDYDNKAEAQIHLHAIKADKYAAIIDLENPAHKKKMEEMLNVNSNYQIYWAVVKDTKEIMKRLEIKYKDHIRRYIMNKTNLRPKASETVSTSLVVNYGEIYLIIKAGNSPITVKFEDIEKA